MKPERTLTVPCGFDKWLLIQARFPLTQAEWDAMIDVLVAMKPGLVADPEPVGWLDHIAGRDLPVVA